MERILVINPGSTSTKIAVYDGVKQIAAANIGHTDEELAPFLWVMDQRGFRTDRIISALEEAGIELASLTCVMSRGGMIPPCHAGAYRINADMVRYMLDQKHDTHISNVGCAVAYDIAEPLGIPAFIYDPVTVDELQPVARVTGMPELPHKSRGHALNSRAMAIRCADTIVHKPFDECTFIVAHLGGGVSFWLFDRGRAIDMFSDDDAAFAPERCGNIQAMELVKLCFSGEYTLREVSRKIRGNAGFRALLGTSDAREVERRIADGDEKAALVYEAFTYGIAKTIGALATAVSGNVTRIILTGGIAYSNVVSEAVSARVSWIAPVEVMPGEHEMQALCEGGLRVLSGREPAHDFTY
ncbi:MAG: butyrate kinase [Clostridia bacterium]|nr:butyrate kinase [Clostridia bacterium]